MGAEEILAPASEASDHRRTDRCSAGFESQWHVHLSHFGGLLCSFEQMGPIRADTELLLLVRRSRRCAPHDGVSGLKIAIATLLPANDLHRSGAHSFGSVDQV